MSKFIFITDEDFRKSLESDYKEMNSCIEHEDWKAAHVLAGSIVEAVLIEYLISADLIPREEALKMDFGQAIAACKDKKVISSKTADLSSVVKGYRNLIHPGRLLRLNETVNRNSAEVAQALVSIVLEEIEKEKRENYGYTAEQIVSKLERDSVAEAIIPHLLKQTNAREIERLLLKLLPEKYAEVNSTDRDDPFILVPDYVLPAFIACFKKAFEQAPDDTKKKTVERFAKRLFLKEN